MTLSTELRRAALADLPSADLEPATLRALVDRAHEWLDAEPGRTKTNARRRLVRAIEREVGDCALLYLQVHVAAVEIARAERKVRGLTR